MDNLKHDRNTGRLRERDRRHLQRPGDRRLCRGVCGRGHHVGVARRGRHRRHLAGLDGRHVDRPLYRRADLLEETPLNGTRARGAGVGRGIRCPRNSARNSVSVLFCAEFGVSSLFAERPPRAEVGVGSPFAERPPRGIRRGIRCQFSFRAEFGGIRCQFSFRGKTAAGGSRCRFSFRGKTAAGGSRCRFSFRGPRTEVGVSRV